MCGIVGVIVSQKSNFEVSESYITKMRDTMIHRGPDGKGLWISEDRKIGFGHRRLSIIDKSSNANQPMCNENKDIWLIYNGEIYNHTSLRSEIEKTGRHCWRTDHSDTEVIIHAYEEWGIDCIHRFRGMFAFALWDGRKNELWLVRDRVGIKPLYYSIHNGRLVFASEIKSLLLDPQQKRELDNESFYHYLTFLTSSPHQTLFAGIKKLSGGTYIRVTPDINLYEYKYWDVLDYVEPLTNLDEDEIASRILEELRVAVQFRKVSDVPVGVFLSGGIDSSINATLFSENDKSQINTFTIGYTGEYKSYKNEMSYARLIAERVNANHHERLLKVDDLLNFLPDMVYQQDEPIADTVCIPLYYVSELTRQSGVIVCQVGEGADELFCGYPFWKEQMQLQSYSNHSFLKNFVNFFYLTSRLIGAEDTVKFEFLRRAKHNLPIFWGGAIGFPEIPKRKLLSENMKKELADLDSWDIIKPIWNNFCEKSWEKSSLQWMTYLDLNFRLPELLLMRVDKMSMAVSLEARVPFLDHNLIETVMGIPSEIKLKNGVLKYILKKAVNGMLPESFIKRKKQGFGIPLQEWFYEKISTIAFREIRKFCKQTNHFDYKQLNNLFNRGNYQRIWSILNFILWWNRFIGN